MREVRDLVATLDGLLDDLDEHPDYGGLRLFAGMLLCHLAGVLTRE